MCAWFRRTAFTYVMRSLAIGTPSSFSRKYLAMEKSSQSAPLLPTDSAGVAQ